MVADPSGRPGAQVRDQSLRQDMVEVAQRLVTQNLNRGTCGNVGVRLPKSFLVTPSGVSVDRLSPGTIVEVDYAGATLGPGVPSSEWRIHRDILLARPKIGAVVHTHSRYATTLACLNREVPPFHYMIAVAGGDTIRCAPYALFGSQELSELALRALANRKACLLGNHGLIALGRDLAQALAVAVEVEALCEQYWSALLVGEPNLLTASQMQAVLEKFVTYGQSDVQ